MAYSHNEHWSLESSMHAKSLQLCPTLCDPMDCSPPGSPVHGIIQARILEWVGIPFSRGIFPTQGLNSGLLLCRRVLYRLSHQASPLIPTWLWSFSLTYLPTSLHPEASYSIIIIHLLGGSTDQPWQKSSMGLKMNKAFFFFSFLIGRKLQYNVVLVSIIQQCKSAIIIHISPSSWASLPSLHSPIPPARSSQSPRLGSLLYIATSHQLSFYSW